MVNRTIAVEDLREEQVDDRHGIEQTATPGVIDLAADVEDLGSVELLSGSLPESAKDANDSVMHDVLPVEVVSVYHLYDRKEHFVQLFPDTRFASIGLMPFGIVPLNPPLNPPGQLVALATSDPAIGVANRLPSSAGRTSRRGRSQAARRRGESESEDRATISETIADFFTMV
jgi:hypothetical protein